MTDEEVQAAVRRAADAVEAKMQAPTNVRRAFWDLRNGLGRSIGEITLKVNMELMRRGYTEEQLSGEGLSHDSIGKYVKGERP